MIHLTFYHFSYQQSEKYLKTALEKIQDVSHEVVAEKWEPLLNNLGHACRKLKQVVILLLYAIRVLPKILKILLMIEQYLL